MTRFRYIPLIPSEVTQTKIQIIINTTAEETGIPAGKSFKDLNIQHWHIIELFALCKGGNFNIHIWACSAISSAKQEKSGSIYNLVKN